VEELGHEASTKSDAAIAQLAQDYRDAAALALSRAAMSSVEAEDGEKLKKSIQRSLGLIQVSTNPMTRRMLERGSPDELVFFSFCRLITWHCSNATLLITKIAAIGSQDVVFRVPITFGSRTSYSWARIDTCTMRS
jgi:hypothetical protein